MLHVKARPVLARPREQDELGAQGLDAGMLEALGSGVGRIRYSGIDHLPAEMDGYLGQVLNTRRRQPSPQDHGARDEGSEQRDYAETAYDPSAHRIRGPGLNLLR